MMSELLLDNILELFSTEVSPLQTSADSMGEAAPFVIKIWFNIPLTALQDFATLQCSPLLYLPRILPQPMKLSNWAAEQSHAYTSFANIDRARARSGLIKS